MKYTQGMSVVPNNLRCEDQLKAVRDKKSLNVESSNQEIDELYAPDHRTLDAWHSALYIPGIHSLLPDPLPKRSLCLTSWDSTSHLSRSQLQLV